MINRQKLIEAVEESTMINVFNPYEGRFEDCIKLETVIELINSQPPADQWIPCSSGAMPTDGKEVLVTTELYKDKRFMNTATYRTKMPKGWSKFDWEGEGFYQYHTDVGYIKREDVIAWMPLPEPYTQD